MSQPSGITQQPEYLGDGAYVRLNDDGQVVLFTSDGMQLTNAIHLEPEVLASFKEWLERMGL